MCIAIEGVIGGHSVRIYRRCDGTLCVSMEGVMGHCVSMEGGVGHSLFLWKV